MIDLRWYCVPCYRVWMNLSSDDEAAQALNVYQNVKHRHASTFSFLFQWPSSADSSLALRHMREKNCAYLLPVLLLITQHREQGGDQLCKKPCSVETV